MFDDGPISPERGVIEISAAEPDPLVPGATLQAAQPNSDQPHIPGGDTPMLDVHPPHEPIHSWKAYLLHMSTIVLGLLIAIGLEQSVEAIHRSHERQELRESLQRESEKARNDSEKAELAESDGLLWLNARIQLVQAAVAAHKPLPAQLPRKPHITADAPIDPAWNAAKSSGLLSLLTQEEVEVYSEADLIFAMFQTVQQAGIDASYKRAHFEIKHAIDPQHPGLIDLSRATPEELNSYIDLLQGEYGAWDQFRVGCQYLRGLETAILAGERDLGRINQAKRQFYTPDPRPIPHGPS
jgi:hypothetical protein